MATTASIGTGLASHPVLPSEALEPLAQHLQKARIGVEHRHAQLRAGRRQTRACNRERVGSPFLRRGASLEGGPAGSGVEIGPDTGFSHALSGEIAAPLRTRAR